MDDNYSGKKEKNHSNPPTMSWCKSGAFFSPTTTNKANLQKMLVGGWKIVVVRIHGTCCFRKQTKP